MLILTIITIVFAYSSLDVSRRTLNLSVIQFQKNSNTSDSLFKYQITFSKELNDSLIRQIKKLTSITNKQLSITDRQLMVLTKTLDERIESGRPIMQALSIAISDTSSVNRYNYKLTIRRGFKNVGQRYAINFCSRQFLILPDNITVKTQLFPKEHIDVEPEKTIDPILETEIPIIYKTNFYFCCDISYFDDVLKKNFYYTFYYQYGKVGNGYDFIYCKDDKRNELKEIINNYLTKIGVDKFEY
jgi:hypothetical protein